MADEILCQLHLNIPDLLAENAHLRDLNFRSIALLSESIGPDMAEFNPERRSGAVAFPMHALSGLDDPVAARLGDDPRNLPLFKPSDLVLIDQSRAARLRILRTEIYVVQSRAGVRLRYVRRGTAKFYLLSEDCLRAPSQWESFAFSERALLDVVRGRIVSVSRQMEPAPRMRLQLVS